MIRIIKCQNCIEELGQIDDVGTITINPQKCETICQGLDEHHSLITFQCPKCGCLLQVKC